jgi:hypothetical protein
MRSSYFGTTAAALLAASAAAPQKAMAQTHTGSSDSFGEAALEAIHGAALQAPASIICGAFDRHRKQGAMLSDRQRSIRYHLTQLLSGFAHSVETDQLEYQYRKLGAKAAHHGGLCLETLERSGAFLLKEHKRLRDMSHSVVCAFREAGLGDDVAAQAALRMWGNHISPRFTQAEVFAQLANATEGKVTPKQISDLSKRQHDALVVIGQIQEGVAPGSTSQKTTARLLKRAERAAARIRNPGLVSRQLKRLKTATHSSRWADVDLFRTKRTG